MEYRSKHHHAVQETTFDNGLRVITQQIPGMHTVSLGIWLASGARHEQPAEYGIAHFIEHLLFKGTERRSARQINREIDSLGGLLNAFTSYEYVCYYAKSLAGVLPQVTDILTDMFLHSTFPDEELERERGVVLQEIKMHEDTPDEHIHDRLHQSFWQGHPLGHPILGNFETISSISRNDILKFREKWYRPSEIMIAAAGGVEHQQLADLAYDQFSKLQPAPPCKECEAVRHTAGAKVMEMTERDMEQILFCIGTKGLPVQSPDRYTLMLLNTILGGGMSSRLFEEIREKRGMAYSVYSYLSSFSDAGALSIFAGTERERSNEALQIILAELDRFKTELVPKDELNSAREQVKGKILMSLESSDSYMMRLARSYLNFGRFQPVDEVIAGFDAVTEEDILQLAAKLLREEHLNIQIMGRMNGLEFK